MSNFLGFESFLIPSGSTITTVRDTLETALTSRGYQVVERSIVPVATIGSWTNYGNAWDGDSTTTTGGGAGWTGVKMAQPFTPAVLHVISENGASSQGPKAFTLDYSDDGVTWTTLQSWTSETGWYPQQRRVYTLTGATAHTYWRLNVTLGNGGNPYVSQVVLYDATGVPVCTSAYTELIPPSSEAIGNADSRDQLRIEVPFGGTTLFFRNILFPLTARPQIMSFWQVTAGAVTPSITINGSTVSGPVGLVTNTAQQNLRALYEAVRASSDPNFTAFNWEYQKPSPQNADDTNDWIYAWQKVPGPNATVTATNVGVRMIGVYWPANTKEGVSGVTVGGNLSIDLNNGFIYYLQVNSRGIALATKTNSAFSGPLHACWATHNAAIAAMPPTFGLSKVSPIELLIGNDNDSTYATSVAAPSHWWAIPQSTSTGFSGFNASNGNDWTMQAPFTRHNVRDKFQDAMASMPWTALQNYCRATLIGSNVFNNNSTIANDFQVHRVSLPNETITSQWYNGMIPVLEIQDWYKFDGTATDEALLLVSDTVTVTSLTTDLATTDAVVNVVSTAGFQTSGYLVVENEIIQYTGITGTSFTGCTRGKYGSTLTNHFANDAVGQGLWIVKILGGALFAGYQKPS